MIKNYENIRIKIKFKKKTYIFISNSIYNLNKNVKSKK